MAKGYLQSLMGEHEKVILVTRQHWFLLFGAILAEIVISLVLLVATIILAVVFPPYRWLIILAGVICLVIPFAFMLRDILIWSNREYIVTNRRVIQIAGVFNKDTTDSSLDKVNDVKMTQSALGRMFDFGDIEILTASELGVNLFKHIERPIRFKTAMINAKEELERGVPSGQTIEDIPAMIARLDDLRKRGVLTEEEFQQKKADLLSRM